jgi:hypothetical protein
LSRRRPRRARSSIASTGDQPHRLKRGGPALVPSHRRRPGRADVGGVRVVRSRGACQAGRTGPRSRCARCTTPMRKARNLNGAVTFISDRRRRERRVSSARIVLELPGFLGLGPIIQTTDLIATLPRHIGSTLAQANQLALHTCPFQVTGFAVCQHWHARHHQEAGHRWLHGVVSQLFGRAGRRAAPGLGCCAAAAAQRGQPLPLSPFAEVRGSPAGHGATAMQRSHARYDPYSSPVPDSPTRLMWLVLSSRSAASTVSAPTVIVPPSMAT